MLAPQQDANVPKTAAQVRQEFLDFFAARGHEVVDASPVVPLDDPTLLFTNAGMNQFKDVFLGTGSRGYVRAADSQPCIRAGGKHNDLDDVGHDTYHHTLFEMLGNWSFGDYFKREAIAWAWELLTQVWGLDPRRLHATYFGGLRRGGTEARRHGGTEGDEATERRSDGGTEARRHEGTEGGEQGKGNREQVAEGDRGSGIGDRQGTGNRKQGGADVSPVAGRSDGPDEWELEPDYEARDIWLTMPGMAPERVHPGSVKDNFWEMGDTGPCGPCSEIHIDLTPDGSGGPLVNAGDPRVIEIWNLVFIQFNRGRDGKLTPLPARHVDTGMGLERIASVLQRHHNNYATDVFVPIIAAVEEMTGHEYGGGEQGTGNREQRGAGSGERGPGKEAAGPWPDPRSPIPDPSSRYAVFRPDNMQDVACRVIADHIRTLTFALADGALPDKEGRGYVLRRILRRAVRYGWQYLNLHEPFLCKLVPVVVDTLGDAFPRLRKRPEWIAQVIREEEESFARTLGRGITLFEEAAEYARKHHHGQIRGEDAFKLHDTYGFPIDLTQIMAQEKGLRVDLGEYERLMEEARERARGQRVQEVEDIGEVAPGGGDDSLKYRDWRECAARIVSIAKSGPSAGDAASQGDRIVFSTDQTCFYAEQGGQVSDKGWVRTNTGAIRVESVTRRSATIDGADGPRLVEFFPHSGVVTEGTVSQGQACKMGVLPERRVPTMQNHTATHILNWTLREQLGDHVQQKGSLVDPEKTRFDFSHPKALTREQVERIEALCVEQIRRDLPVETNNDEPVDQKAAMRINGLRAVFGEKYPDRVRVVSIGVPVAELLANPENPEWRKTSIEFCGGTHVRRTGEIEDFALISEEAVAKGVRRVVGISGQRAREARAAGEELLKRTQELVATPPAEPAREVAIIQQQLTEQTVPLTIRYQILDALEKLQQLVREQKQQHAAAAADVVQERVEALLGEAERIGATTVVIGEMPDVPIEQLKAGADWIKQKSGSAAVLFGVRQDGEPGKVILLAAMSPDLVGAKLSAGDLVKHVARIVGGGGGGPPTMAQAGGRQPEKLPEALEAGRAWVRAKLGSG